MAPSLLKESLLGDSMKHILLLSLFALLVACGKSEKKSSSQSYSLSSLESVGISVYSNNPYIGGRVAIVCSSGQTTNAQKINQLSSFITSLGIYNSNSTGFQTGGVSLTPSETGALFNGALNTLQMGNPNSTACPRQILYAI